ncbi:trypsin-like peptidase domain-containing protein [Microbacterium sp.]|uniref:S1C family serine protease n=1 Tax=Microbacterium sp. TaxID=51671 RepID=UPI00333F9780
MNENNTPGEAGTPQSSHTDAAAGVPAGHEVPASFSSESTVPPASAAETPAAPASAAPAPAAPAPVFPAPGSTAAAAQPSPGAQPSAPQQGAPQPGYGAQQAPSAPAGNVYTQPYGAAPGAHAAPHTPSYGGQHGAGAQGAYGAPGAAFGVSPQHTAQTLPIDPPHTAQAGTAKKAGGGARIAALIVAAALVGGVAGIGGSALWSSTVAQPQGSPASGPQAVTVNNPGSVNETTAIATKVLPSVVTIEVSGSNESGSGSGVILDKEGHVLTNTHVVTLGGAVSKPTIRVTTSDGRIYDATVVGTDPIYDLAVIQLKDAKDLTPIEFGDSSKLNVGDTAVAIGAPLGLSNSVTTGVVSALNRSIQVASSAVPKGGTGDQQQGDGSQQNGGPFQFDIPGMGSQQQASQSISLAVIQTDAAINPGNSGGALVDSKGNLIGINVAIATAGGSSSSGSESGSIGLGFAIPSDVAKRVADQILKDGAATHGLLGASVRDASSVESATVAGAYIVDITSGGAAGAAGLQKGDVVTEINGIPVSSSSDLTAQVRALAGGATTKVTYVRDGKSYTADVTLGTLKL